MQGGWVLGVSVSTRYDEGDSVRLSGGFALCAAPPHRQLWRQPNLRQASSSWGGGALSMDELHAVRELIIAYAVHYMYTDVV